MISQLGLLRPLLGSNWFNWSWTGLALNLNVNPILRSCEVTTGPGTELVLLDWTPCCSPSLLLSASEYSTEQRGLWVKREHQRALLH